MKKLVAVFVFLIGVIVASGILQWPLVQGVAFVALGLLFVWTVVAAIVAAVDYM